jgi:transposase
MRLRDRWPQEAHMLGEMHDTPQQDATLSIDLSIKELQAISVLATGASVSEAARVCEVHRATIHRWLAQDSRFVEELERAKAQQLLNVRSELRSLVLDAIQTLRALMTGDDVCDEVRLKAAVSVLQTARGLAPEPPEAVGPANSKCLR